MRKRGGLDPKVQCLEARDHMRRSSLGSGRGSPGFSGPAALVCFLSSALGLYVPSILRFFLMRHRSSSRTKVSRDSTADANAGNVGEVHACVAMATGRGLAHGSGADVTENRLFVIEIALFLKK